MVSLAAIECERDKVKFEALYLKYRQTMFYIANSILRDAPLSEDAVHQAFMRIMDHMHKIADIECPQTKSFVVIIVRNVAINLYNSRKKKAVLSLDEIEGWTAGEEETPVQAIESEEDYQRLIALIERMPEGYRSVLMLKYDNGYSASEISSMLGLSEENVKKRLQRAKKKLEQMMEEVAAR